MVADFLAERRRQAGWSTRRAVPDRLMPPMRVLRRFLAARASSVCSSEVRSSPDS
jgi:hypothetical protein